MMNNVAACDPNSGHIQYSHLFDSVLGHSNLITCLTSFFWKKRHLWCLTDESGFEIFCQTPKKRKKSASFKNMLCKGDSINYRKLSLL